jgi:uncharacterized OB-fold protein
VTAPRARPQPTEVSAGFWKAAKRHELVVQRCGGCGVRRHYPQMLCPACQSAEWDWTPVSGRGTIYSFTVTHQAFHPAFADRVPYVVATIELEEGIRMVSDLPDDDVDSVAIGMEVAVFYDDIDDDLTLPRFRLKAGGADWESDS